MSIAHAKTFIKRASLEPKLIYRINEAPDQHAVQMILTEEGLSFNVHEFEEAYSNLLTQCQTIDQANMLNEIKMWWELLGQYFLAESA